MRTPLLLLAAACTPNTNPVPGPSESGCVAESFSLSASDGVVRAHRGTCGTVELRPRVFGEGQLDVRFDMVDGAVQPVITGSGTWTALVLEGPWDVDGHEPQRLWRQGYQSWSWSGVLPIENAEFDADNVPTLGGDGDGTSSIYATAWSSWWVGLVGRSDGDSLLMGVRGATLSRFAMAAQDDEIWAIWGHRGEAVLVDGELALDPLHIGISDDPQALYEEYADATAGALGIAAPDATPPTGWATWYQFYSDVNETDVRDNLELAATINARGDLAPIEVFQIDDGWQQRWGDWRAGPEFPSGMATLAADIDAAGFTPGLWMAPFYVSRESSVYTDHPDWWVRDTDGAEITFANLGTGDYVIIDATNPDAGAWMAQQVADRVAEGWTYLKLDFLYAGAQEGVRAADVTGIEAYHVGMQLLRDAAGDAWVLACGAPMLPTLGYAEQFRSGADIAFEIDPDPDLAYLRWQARSTGARAWQNGRWWWNDPDQIILREPFTDTTAQGAVVAQIVSGGAWLLGDDLVALPEQRLALALDPALAATRGQTVRPLDPLLALSGLDPGPTGEMLNPDDHPPMRWQLADGRVALLNLTDDDLEVDGPGGVEQISGASTTAGPRLLRAGVGELWQP